MGKTLNNVLLVRELPMFGMALAWCGGSEVHLVSRGIVIDTMKMKSSGLKEANRAMGKETAKLHRYAKAMCI